MDYQSISRAITLLEASPSSRCSREVLAWATGESESSRTRVIGITGPPGAGKSTLIGALAATLRDRGRAVAVLAVDATSPYTGGSFLGNRLRMEAQLHSKGIFMRSMASRGALGGLGRHAYSAIAILESAGFDYVFVETVGAGQSDYEVSAVSDLTVLVLSPGFGDVIQALKAGLMEVADVYVINKADSGGADEAEAQLRAAVGDNATILKVSALKGYGLEDLVELVERSGRTGGDRSFRAAGALARALVIRMLDDAAKEGVYREFAKKRGDIYRVALRLIRSACREASKGP